MATNASDASVVLSLPRAHIAFFPKEQLSSHAK